MSNLEHLLKQFSGKKVLVAPMDWGLGHATRCIPMIRSLISLNAEVFIGAEGSVATLLNREFPQLKILPLKGYRIKYAKSKSLFFLNILLQLPKIWSAVKNEKKWLDKIIENHKIDIVISDNRLGLYSKKSPSYFITHQLRIKTSFGILDNIVQQINYRFINQFQECWVPDLEEKNNYAGELSHPEKLPNIPVRYIGLLSRFHKSVVQKKYKIAIVLSGPEPQRTMLEQIILEQFKNIDFPLLLIRGLPGENNSLQLPNKNIDCNNHLNGEELSLAMQQSELVLARSGYSTIMDLVAIGQQAVLIPTPGQSEQEYLAKYLSEKGVFKMMLQSEVQLNEILKELPA